MIQEDAQITQVLFGPEEIMILPKDGQDAPSRGRTSEARQPGKVVRFPSTVSSTE